MHKHEIKAKQDELLATTKSPIATAAQIAMVKVFGTFRSKTEGGYTVNGYDYRGKFYVTEIRESDLGAKV